MDLLGLAVKIAVDDQTSKKVKDIAGSIKGKLATAAKVGALAVTATGAAASGMTAALTKAAGEVSEYGDSIDKMSQKMGLTAEAYQEWDAVMQHSGTSMSTMKASMKTLANAAQTNNEAFEKLGLSQKEIADMSQQELFEATIAGLQNVSDTTERTYLAGKLLGRGATELGALLNTSAEDTQAMRDRVHELGGVMSDEAVKASARYQDSLQDMMTAASGFKRVMVSEFLPGMATVMDGLGEIFSGNSDGVAKVEEGLTQIVDKVRAVAPAFMERVSEIAPVLVQAIVEIVSVVASQLPTLALQLVPVIVGLAPTIMNAGIQMFMGLVQALTETGPELIDGIVDAVLQMAEMLVANAPAMLVAALTLFATLAIAIAQKIPEIVAKLGQLVVMLVTGLIEHGPEMLAAALELMASLAEGIGEGIAAAVSFLANGLKGLVSAVASKASAMAAAAWRFVSGIPAKIAQGATQAVAKAGELVGKVVNKVKELPGKVKSGLGNMLGVLKNAGRDVIQGFINGIESMISNVKSKLKFITDLIPKNKGPESRDRVLLYDNGKLIMQGLMSGIESGIPSLKAQLGGVTKMIDGTSGTIGYTRSALATQGAGGGDVYNIYLQPDMNDANSFAMAFTEAVETRNRLKGRKSNVTVRMV